MSWLRIDAYHHEPLNSKANTSDKPKPSGLAVIAVYVDELEPALAFYRDQLGFEVTGEMPPGKLLWLGDLKLYLEPGRAPRDSKDVSNLARAEVAMVLFCGQVLALRDALEQAGVPIVGPTQGNGESFAMIRVADPAGNLVEIAGQP